MRLSNQEQWRRFGHLVTAYLTHNPAQAAADGGTEMAVALAILGMLALGGFAFLESGPRAGTVTVTVLPPSKPVARAVEIRAPLASPYRLRTSTL